MGDQGFLWILGILGCYWVFMLIRGLEPAIEDSDQRILVLLIKDQGYTIEGIIRYLLHRNQYYTQCNLRLICIDLGSADETLAILSNLQRKANEIWSICSLDERKARLFVEDLQKVHPEVRVFLLVGQEDGREVCAALSRELA